MVEIRRGRPGEEAAQKVLWRSAFGDGDEVIDWFYHCCGAPDEMMLLLEEGRLASMLALLPMELALPDGSRASSAYIYALATDPGARKHGYGRQLLRYVDTYLTEKGVDCVTVVPAEPSLHKFFGTVDFQACFTTRKQEMMQNQVGQVTPGDWAKPITPAEYGELREALLEGEPSVRYPQRLIQFQEGFSKQSGAGLYRLEVGGLTGCAAAEYLSEETLMVKELLITPPQMPAALAALAEKLPARRYHVRTPAGWEGLPGSYLQPFGMVKWYNRAKAEAWGEDTRGYMGLGFD